MLVKDFPGGTVDKNQPSDAEDMGDPWSRKTSTFRKATKLGCHNYWTCMPRACGPQQKPLHGSKELYPLFGTRESLCTVTKTQHSQKKKIFILKNASKVVEKLNHLCINEWLPWSMGSQSVGHNWTAFTHTHTHTHTQMHQWSASHLALWKRICLPALEMQEKWILSLGWEEPLKKEMAAHSSIHPWIIPKAKEPGGLQSTGSQKIRTRLSD